MHGPMTTPLDTSSPSRTDRNADDTDPITPMQRAELDRLCDRTGEEIEPNLSEAQAERRIETLRALSTLPCRQ